jgi:hypothetical protein
MKTMFKAKISEFNKQKDETISAQDFKYALEYGARCDEINALRQLVAKYKHMAIECYEYGGGCYKFEDLDQTENHLKDEDSPDKRKIRRLEREIKYLKASTPQETLEETITERLGDNWVDYMDSKGLKRDPDGLCPAELETAFIGLVEGLHKFFKSNRIDGGFSHHSSRNRELMVGATPNDLELGVGVLEISPLQWELMIAITQYIEGHVIDSEEIVYLAEER